MSVSYFVVAVNAVLNMLFTLLYELFLCMFDNVQLRELVHTGVEHYVRVIIINKQYSDLTKHSWTGNQIASPSRDLGPLHSRTAVAVCPLLCAGPRHIRLPMTSGQGRPMIQSPNLPLVP